MNVGERAWPKGTSVRYQLGDFGHSQRQDYVIVLDKEVQPDKDYTWFLELRAPQKLGSYKVDFGLYSLQGTLCERDLGGG